MSINRVPVVCHKRKKCIYLGLIFQTGSDEIFIFNTKSVVINIVQVFLESLVI
jgi:hypothetical protein